MRNNLFNKLAVGAVMLSSIAAKGQISSRVDQFYLDPSVVNPAGIVFQKYSSLNMFYNKTWSGVTGSPENVIANLVMPLKNKATGFGLFYLREKAGFQQLHNAYATYAYAFELGEKTHWSFAASAGILSQSFDPSKAIYIQQNDPVIRSITYSPTANRADFRASTMLQAGGFTLGGAFSRLAKPRFDYSYYNYKTSYSLQNLCTILTGYNFQVSENFAIKPMILATSYNFDYWTFKGNLNFNIMDKFWAGVSSDAASQVGFNIGFKAGGAVVCGYSVTVMAGKMKGILGPVHEFYTSIPFGGSGKRAAASDDKDKDEVAKNDEDEDSDESSDTKKTTETKRRMVNTDVKSMDDLKNAGTDLDTAGIHLTPLDQNTKQPGIYLVVGMHTSEAKADKQIKDLYMKGILAYKFYDPVNHSYYVWVKQFKTMAEANAYVLSNEDPNLPQTWIRVVK